MPPFPKTKVEGPGRNYFQGEKRLHAKATLRLLIQTLFRERNFGHFTTGLATRAGECPY